MVDLFLITDIQVKLTFKRTVIIIYTYIITNVLYIYIYIPPTVNLCVS